MTDKANGENRVCAWCQEPLEGPPSKRYCDERCRQAAKRARRNGWTGKPIDGRPGDLGELFELLWRAARRGNVAAIKTLLRLLPDEPVERDQYAAVIDLLARRHKRSE